MASELSPIDLATIPELAKLADEVERARQSRRLHRADRDVALLTPLAPAVADEPPRPTTRPLRFPKGSLVAATAGIVQYEGPTLTLDQERAAFEQALADDAEDTGT